jgi:hypothetical protein
MKIMKAQIDWISKEQGGRTKPPIGIGSPSYCSVIHFIEEPWPNPGVTWTLVVEKCVSESTEYHWKANIRFRVNNAPHDTLIPGRLFKLHEGPKCVAYGEILGECDSEPSIHFTTHHYMP